MADNRQSRERSRPDHIAAATPHGIQSAYPRRDRDDSPSRNAYPSLSQTTRLSMARQQRREPDRLAYPPAEEEEYRSIAIINYKTEADHSHLIERALPLFKATEESGFTDTESIVQGLNFMVRAAGLGNEDALDYLTSFIHEVVPNTIPEDGPMYHAIKDKLKSANKLIGLSEEDRRLWKVFLENFLTMSGHRKTLRRRQFDEAVESLLLDREESPQKNKLKMVHKALLREALQKGKDPDEVTDDVYCDTVVSFTTGKLAIDFEMEDMTEADLERFRKAGIMEKILGFPARHSFDYIARKEVPKYVDKNAVHMLRGFFPTKEIFLLVAAFAALSLSRVIAVAGLILFWPLLGGMIISTFLLLSNHDRTKGHYEVWSRYISRERGVVVDARLSETSQLQLVTKYYAAIFGLCVAVLLTFHASKDLFISPEVVCGGAFIMFVVVCLGRKIWNKKILSLAALVKMVSMALYMGHGLMLLFVKDSVFELPFLNWEIVEWCFYVGYLVLGLVHVSIATWIFAAWLRSGKMYFYTIAGPFIVTSLWWLLWMVFWKFLTDKDYVVNINWMMFFISHVPILIPPFVTIKVMYLAVVNGPHILLGVLVVVGVCALLLACYRFGKSVAKSPVLGVIQFNHLVIIFTVVLPIATLVLLSDIYVTFQQTQPPADVKWKDYVSHCGPQKWLNNGNMAAVQVNCSRLEGRQVLALEGIVQFVKVVSQENVYITIFDKFSDMGQMHDAGHCLFGSETRTCSEDGDSVCEEDPCNLHYHDKSVFAIEVSDVHSNDSETERSQIEGTFDVSLLVHSSKHVLEGVRKLAKGMGIRFNATLYSGLGSNKVQLKLDSFSIKGQNVVYSNKGHVQSKERNSHLWDLAKKISIGFLHHFQTFLFGHIFIDDRNARNVMN